MPAISRFLGITIWMYHNDHAPPHFHATYGDDEAQVDIETVARIEGRLPPRVMGLVLEWAGRHIDELRTNWELARDGQPVRRIAPLE